MPDEKRKLDVQFEVVPETMEAQFRKDFPFYIHGMVRSVPGNYLTFPEYPKRAEEIYNLLPRSDDVYVLTFPKSGLKVFTYSSVYSI